MKSMRIVNFKYFILPLNPLNSIIENFCKEQIPGMFIEYPMVFCLSDAD
jgi:hypothetical protein